MFQTADRVTRARPEHIVTPVDIVGFVVHAWFALLPLAIGQIGMRGKYLDRLFFCSESRAQRGSSTARLTTRVAAGESGQVPDRDSGAGEAYSSLIVS